MKPKVDTYRITEEELNDILHFNIASVPSNFYFIDAAGDYIFILTKKYIKALAYLEDEWDNKYSLRTFKPTGSNGKTLTARGTATRKGQKKYN